MKRNLFLLFALVAFSVNSFGQVTGSSFEFFVSRYRFGPQPLDYFEKNNIEVTNLLTLGSIAQDGNVNKVDASKVRYTVGKLFPYSRSGGKLVLDWEKTVFYDIRNYPVTDSRYKAAEAEWKKLISIIREMRPNVEIGIYGMPFRSWYSHAVLQYNPEGKYDALLSLTDFLAPSIYLQHPDEEVGRERNLQYIKDNMNAFLSYGKRLRKPVYPFFWHRMHPISCDEYTYELIQPEVFAYYIKFIANYSYNNYKASGAFWWEAYEDRRALKKLNGINNWARGLVTSTETYDALMVKYAAATVKALGGVTSEPSVTAGTQQVVSYTLFDAKTGADIQKLTNGATLNLATLPTNNLNIRANTNTSVGSVVFSLSGTQSKHVTESVASYDLMGDNGSWTPATGSYTLKATPYSGSKATGSAGTSLSVSFSVENNSSATASSSSNFILVNADTDKDIQTLASGATINLAALPTKNLSIRYGAEAAGGVVFYLSGTESRTQDESGAPYALFGDNNGDYRAWTPALGSYSLKVTSSATSESINFRVVNNTSSSIGITYTSNAVAVGGKGAAEAELAGEKLIAYPNPATTVLNVDLGSGAAEGVTTVDLRDINGKVVLTKNVNTATDGRKTELDLTRLSRGIYILSVNSSAGRTTKRIVVN